MAQKMLYHARAALWLCAQWRPTPPIGGKCLRFFYAGGGRVLFFAERVKMGREAPLLVAVTGYGQQEDRRRAAEAGFDRHLVKPVGLDALQDVLIEAAAARSGVIGSCSTTFSNC